MRIPIVDENDNIVEYKEKKDLLPADINRDTGLFILNEKNEILLAQRSANKKVYPNLWTVAVAGTVEEGETYESNIIKEAKEEIGLEDIKPIFIFKCLRESEHRRMGVAFTVIISSTYEFKTEPAEISEIKWFSREELEKSLITTPEMFTPTFAFYYNKFKDYENQN